MKTKRTLILALTLCFLLGAGCLVWRRTLSGDSSVSGLCAVVEVRGQPYATLPLSEDQELTVNDTLGGYNLIRVEDGCVFVEDANCGDLTCVRTGKMGREGDLIACLPHGVIIYIVNLEDS